MEFNPFGFLLGRGDPTVIAALAEEVVLSAVKTNSPNSSVNSLTGELGLKGERGYVINKDKVKSSHNRLVATFEEFKVKPIPFDKGHFSVGEIDPEDETIRPYTFEAMKKARDADHIWFKAVESDMYNVAPHWRIHSAHTALFCLCKTIQLMEKVTEVKINDVTWLGKLRTWVNKSKYKPFVTGVEKTDHAKRALKSYMHLRFFVMLHAAVSEYEVLCLPFQTRKLNALMPGMKHTHVSSDSQKLILKMVNEIGEYLVDDVQPRTLALKNSINIPALYAFSNALHGPHPKWLSMGVSPHREISGYVFSDVRRTGNDAEILRFLKGMLDNEIVEGNKFLATAGLTATLVATERLMTMDVNNDGWYIMHFMLRGLSMGGFHAGRASLDVLKQMTPPFSREKMNKLTPMEEYLREFVHDAFMLGGLPMTGEEYDKNQMRALTNRSAASFRPKPIGVKLTDQVSGEYRFGKNIISVGTGSKTLNWLIDPFAATAAPKLLDEFDWLNKDWEPTIVEDDAKWATYVELSKSIGTRRVPARGVRAIFQNRLPSHLREWIIMDPIHTGLADEGKPGETWDQRNVFHLWSGSTGVAMWEKGAILIETSLSQSHMPDPDRARPFLMISNDFSSFDATQSPRTRLVGFEAGLNAYERMGIANTEIDSVFIRKRDGSKYTYSQLLEEVFKTTGLASFFWHTVNGKKMLVPYFGTQSGWLRTTVSNGWTNIAHTRCLFDRMSSGWQVSDVHIQGDDMVACATAPLMMTKMDAFEEYALKSIKIAEENNLLSKITKSEVRSCAASYLKIRFYYGIEFRNAEMQLFTSERSTFENPISERLSSFASVLKVMGSRGWSPDFLSVLAIVTTWVHYKYELGRKDGKVEFYMPFASPFVALSKFGMGWTPDFTLPSGTGAFLILLRDIFKTELPLCIGEASVITRVVGTNVSDLVHKALYEKDPDGVSRLYERIGDQEWKSSPGILDKGMAVIAATIPMNVRNAADAAMDRLMALRPKVKVHPLLAISNKPKRMAASILKAAPNILKVAALSSASKAASKAIDVAKSKKRDDPFDVKAFKNAVFSLIGPKEIPKTSSAYQYRTNDPSTYAFPIAPYQAHACALFMNFQVMTSYKSVRSTARNVMRSVYASGVSRDIPQDSIYAIISSHDYFGKVDAITDLFITMGGESTKARIAAASVVRNVSSLAVAIESESISMFSPLTASVDLTVNESTKCVKYGETATWLQTNSALTELYGQIVMTMELMWTIMTGSRPQFEINTTTQHGGALYLDFYGSSVDADKRAAWQYRLDEQGARDGQD